MADLPPVSLYVCLYCPTRERFTLLKKFRRHQEEGHGIFPGFECGDCFNRFQYDHLMSRHICPREEVSRNQGGARPGPGAGRGAGDGGDGGGVAGGERRAGGDRGAVGRGAGGVDGPGERLGGRGGGAGEGQYAQHGRRHGGSWVMKTLPSVLLSEILGFIVIRPDSGDLGRSSTLECIFSVQHFGDQVEKTSMELNSVNNAFTQVVNNQKLCSSKAQEVIDKIRLEIVGTITKIKDKQSRNFSDVESILNELLGKLEEMKSFEKLEEFWKQLDDDMSEYDEALERTFGTDISKAYRNNNDYDSKTINGIIARHFYDQHKFQIGNSFVKEANLRLGNLFPGESSDTDDDLQPIKKAFNDMHKLLDPMSIDKFEPALKWVAENSTFLRENGCSLELKLHAIQFMKILQKGDLNAALKYAKNCLEPLKGFGIAKEKLIASVTSIDQPDEWPYAELLSLNGTERSKLQEELKQQFCNLANQSFEGHLRVSVAAGFKYLPRWLKLADDMAPRKQEWESMTQCPEAFDLEKEFMFHSSFICSHCSKEVTPENSLMRLPCGHAMCSDSLESKSNVEPAIFSCHICI